MSAIEMSAATPAPAAQVEKILSINNIEVIYDHVILVLKGVSLDVPKGGIVALLGANGAGKTTTLKAISNLLHAERGDVTKGSILFEGNEVQNLSPNELVRRGCIQVMEGRHCFGHLTIEENLLTGAFTRKDGRAAIKRDMDMVYGYFAKLAEQNTSMALRYATYGYILENGRVVMDGDAKSLAANEDVKEFYLGISEGRRKSFRDGKHYRRRKRWLA